MRRLIGFATLALVVASLLVLGISDTGTSTADSGVSGSQVTASPSEIEAHDPCANATITITMRTPPLPDEFEKPEPQNIK